MTEEDQVSPDTGPVDDGQSLEEVEEVEDVDGIREQLDEALREKDQFRAMAQRAQADLINYKRLAAEEREDLRRTAISHLILEVLAVVDDFDRALAHVPDDAVAPGWLDGVTLVRRNLQRVLDVEGVTKIEAEGQPFEPREHESIYYEETGDGEEGRVVSVIREGYKLHDRVIRPAQVTVSKAPQPQDQPESDREET